MECTVRHRLGTHDIAAIVDARSNIVPCSIGQSSQVQRCAILVPQYRMRSAGDVARRHRGIRTESGHAHGFALLIDSQPERDAVTVEWAQWLRHTESIPPDTFESHHLVGYGAIAIANASLGKADCRTFVVEPIDLRVVAAIQCGKRA